MKLNYGVIGTGMMGCEEICNSNLQMISSLAESLTLLRNWIDKDILLIDNHRVMHGRKPFSGEKNREVLVSLTA